MSEPNTIEVDRENRTITINGQTIALRGEDGHKLPIDHTSSMDGYVAFADKNYTITFEESDN